MGTYHLCENKDEIARVKSLYPDHDGYLDVYHQYGLTGKTASLLTASISKKRVGSSQRNQIQHYFLSDLNLYLGSGLFNLKKHGRRKSKWAWERISVPEQLFNMLQLNKAYKVLQLQGYRLSAYEAFCGTLGGRNLWALTI